MALISALQFLGFFGAALTGRKYGTALMLEALPSFELLPPVPLAAALAAALSAALAAIFC
jgi:hypothetical protein